MASWSNWTPATVYTTLLTWITDKLLDLAKGNDPAKVTVSNPVTDMIRWSSGSSRWEIYGGSTWGQLATSYAINISGSAASAGSVAWSGVTGKPTTAAGYGITDAITTGNIAGQSVNYATSAGSAGVAANSSALGGIAAAQYLRDREILADAADLNGVTAPGSYVCGATYTNGPAAGAFPALIVIGSATGAVRAQILISYATGRLWVRGAGLPTWSAWTEFSATSHTHSYAPMTALVDAARVENVSGNNVIRFTRANGATFDVVIGIYTGGGGS
jgi:hypothetical protein